MVDRHRSGLGVSQALRECNMFDFHDDITERLADRIAKRLKVFTEQLEWGDLIKAVRVTREMTPDGSLYTHEKVVLKIKK